MTDRSSASTQQIIEDSLRMMPAPVAVLGVAHDGIMGGTDRRLGHPCVQ